MNALYVEGIDFLLTEGADLSRVDMTRTLAVLTAAQEAHQQDPASAAQSQLLQSAQRAELAVTRFQRAQSWDRASSLQSQLTAYKQKTELQLVSLRYDLIVAQRAREVAEKVALEAEEKLQQATLKLQRKNRLEEQLQDAKDALLAMRRERDEARQAAQTATKSKQRAEEKLQEHIQEQQQAESAQIQKLKTAVEKSEARVAELRVAHREAEIRATAASDELGGCHTRLQSLQTELDAAKRHPRARPAADAATLQMVRTQLQQTQAELSAARNDAETAITAAVQAQADRAGVRAELVVANQQLAAAVAMRQAQCCSCVAELPSVLLLPCKHIVLCDECNSALLQRGDHTCPACGWAVTERHTGVRH